MENEELEHSILEYLQKDGPVNTFKLASVLEIERDKLLKILKSLEAQGVVRITTGKAEFLSYLPQERLKKRSKVSKKKTELEKFQEEKENQKLYIEKLKDQIKKLEQRPPKVITKTIIKEAKPKVITRTIIKEVTPIKTKRKKKKKREKIKETKIKPKKTAERSVKLRKKSKTVLGVKKSFRKIGLKIKGAAGIFKIKNFIKHLKRKKRR